MRISVVTISFNQSSFVRECIESVLGQDHDDIEYIVVDPGSTNGSREIIAGYGDHLTPVFEPDSGPPDGLNHGFAVSTGDVLGFLNADDQLLPGALARVAEGFARAPQTDVLMGCGYFTDESGRVLRRIVPSRVSPWLFAHGAVTVFQQGTFFRREAFVKAGGFNAADDVVWDSELFLDMALAGAKFRRLDADLALFRIHDRSLTGSGGHTSGSQTYRENLERLFVKATGRPRGRRDWAADTGARLVKYAADPAYFKARVAAAWNWRRRRTRNSEA